MNVVKAKAIVIVVALVVALMGASASAQSPSATPTAGGTNFPGNVPEGWKAEGWSQSDWMALYKQCLNIPAETTRRAHMTPEQLRGLRPIPGDWEGCKHIFSAVGPRPTAGSPQATGLAITPTPMSTPQPPDEPQSLAPDTSDPPIIGSSYAGGGASACPGPSPAPNVQPQTQPLSVAADVSPSQNVEMLNQGLFVYNKSGQLQGGGPEPLYQFWCETAGANGQTLPACSEGGPNNQVALTDTQIAYDSFDSRWVVSTMAVTNDQMATVHDVLFAVSTSANALDGAGAWERYDIPVCTSQNQKYPDQPILGYSSAWVAIDTICLSPSLGNGPDALVLIPNSSIASPPQTLSPTIITPPPIRVASFARRVGPRRLPVSRLPATGPGLRSI